MTLHSLASRTLPVPDLPELAAEQPEDAAAITALVDAAFGPGRFVKAAERLREANHPLLDLSFTAHAHGVLVGSVRLWSIHIGVQPAVFLGPIAVDPAWRKRGLGAALVRRACEAAAEAGHCLVLLVGDPPFFGPLGFSMVPQGRVAMPGPVDPRRLMARPLVPGAAEHPQGAVVPG
ncbi:MAG TPA: N-acetyltransferase [Caulobacteraceae bacterium]|jgi:predicted N-acetyltransferase YhbS|nr:N-acetyltransferase [Caulobacteraceae bacterium]